MLLLAFFDQHQPDPNYGVLYIFGSTKSRSPGRADLRRFGRSDDAMRHALAVLEVGHPGNTDEFYGIIWGYHGIYPLVN